MTFSLLCHNVFWFQGVPFETDTPPAPDTDILGRLCSLYRERACDALLLQEIQGMEAFQAVSGCMGMPGGFCPGNIHPQYGGCSLFKAGARGIPVPEVGNWDAFGSSPQRMWQAFEWQSGPVPLLICNLHLPSNRQLGAERGAAQRVSDLLDVIGRCRREPDILAGDFNERPGGSVGNYLEERGYVDAAVLAGKSAVPTNLGGGRGDYIWIHKTVRNRLLDYDVVGKERLAVSLAGKQYLSDHLPLRITMEA